MKFLKLSAIMALSLGLSACTSTMTTTKTVGGSSGTQADYGQAYQDYLQLGAEYVRRGRYDLAEPKLKRAIEINSRPPEAWNILAVLYEEKRDIAAGDQVYQKLLASHPDYALGFMNYATFLCKFDRNPELDNLYARMRAKGTSFSALSYIAEGNCRQSKNNLAAASSAYRQALTFDNHAAGALLPLADIELSQGNYQAAANYVEVVHTYIGYSAESVRIGILAARGLGNAQKENDLMRVMRGSYQGSEQARTLGI